MVKFGRWHVSFMAAGLREDAPTQINFAGRQGTSLAATKVSLHTRRLSPAVSLLSGEDRLIFKQSLAKALTEGAAARPGTRGTTIGWTGAPNPDRNLT